MELETLFAWASRLAMLGWLVLILAPRKIKWLSWAPRFVIPLMISVLYSVLLLSNFGSSDGGFNSLENVSKLFSSPPVLLAGWVHYLAFDLLVGVFMADMMDRDRVHRLIQAPVLLAIFLAGPLGYLLGLLTSYGACKLSSKGNIKEAS